MIDWTISKTGTMANDWVISNDGYSLSFSSLSTDIGSSEANTYITLPPGNTLSFNISATSRLLYPYTNFLNTFTAWIFDLPYRIVAPVSKILEELPDFFYDRITKEYTDYISFKYTNHSTADTTVRIHFDYLYYANETYNRLPYNLLDNDPKGVDIIIDNFQISNSLYEACDQILEWSTFTRSINSKWVVTPTQGGSIIEYREDPSTNCGGDVDHVYYKLAIATVTLLSGQSCSFDWEIESTMGINSGEYVSFYRLGYISDSIKIYEEYTTNGTISTCGSLQTVIDSGSHTFTNNYTLPRRYQLQLLYDNGSNDGYFTESNGVKLTITNFTISPCDECEPMPIPEFYSISTPTPFTTINPSSITPKEKTILNLNTPLTPVLETTTTTTLPPNTTNNPPPTTSKHDEKCRCNKLGF